MKRTIDNDTPIARVQYIGSGRYILNADADGVAVTLTCVHFCWAHITHPRGGFREMGVLEVTDEDDTDLR